MSLNLAKVVKRVDELKRRLERVTPKASPPPLIIEFCCEVNRNASSGVRARAEGDKLKGNKFVLVPPGYRGPLPEGVPTHDEWLQWNRFAKEDEHVQ